MPELTQALKLSGRLSGILNSHFNCARADPGIETTNSLTVAISSSYFNCARADLDIETLSGKNTVVRRTHVIADPGIETESVIFIREENYRVPAWKRMLSFRGRMMPVSPFYSSFIKPNPVVFSSPRPAQYANFTSRYIERVRHS